MSIRNRMNHSSTIYRKTDSGEGQYGITSESFELLNPKVKCHIQQISRLSSFYRQQLSGIQDKMYFIGYFRHDQDIKEGDRVTWEGYSMVVLSVPPSLGSQGKRHHKEALMELQDK